jgi:hypothetical protein
MINNNYVHELDLDLDIDYLKTKIHNVDSENGEFQQLIEEDSYFNNLKLSYPFLSSKFNIYCSLPKSSIPLHVDANRNCALNIPLENTKRSFTVFYKFIEPPILEYNDKFIFNNVRSKVEETFRFTLTKPTLINNAVPHSVINYSSNQRIILSWSILPEYTFDQVKNILLNNITF